MTNRKTPSTRGLWLVAVLLLTLAAAGIAWAASADIWQRDQDPNGHIVTKSLVVRGTTLATTYVEGGRSATLAARIGANAAGPYLQWANMSGTLPLTLGTSGTGEIWGYFDANGNFEAAALGVGNIPAANNNGHFAVPTYTGIPSSTPSTAVGYAAFGLCKDSNELCAYNPYTTSWLHFPSTTSAAPVNATYITETPNATLTAEFAMSALATGIVKNTTTTGVPSIATAGTDYSAGTSALATGMVKSTTGTGALSIGTAGTDYSAGTSALATGIVKSTTGTGALTIAAAGSDYPATGVVGAGSCTNCSATINANGQATAFSSGATPAPVGATYIVETADGTLTSEFALASLATGILKNTTTTGIPTIAASGSDYQAPMTAGTGISLTGSPTTVINLANTAVTPGSYTTANITVDAQGRLTAASTGTSAAGCVGWAACECQTLISNAGLTNTTATCFLREFIDSTNSGLGSDFTNSTSFGTGAFTALSGIGWQASSGAVTGGAEIIGHVAGLPLAMAASTSQWGISCYFAVSTAIDANAIAVTGGSDALPASNDFAEFGALGATSTLNFAFRTRTGAGTTHAVASAIGIDTAFHTGRIWRTAAPAMFGQIDAEANVALTNDNPAAGWDAVAVAANQGTSATRTLKLDACVFAKPKGT